MEEFKSKIRESHRITVFMQILVFIAGLLIGLIFHDSLVRSPAPDTDIHRWYPR
ncbi:MAG: hypothetical protein WAV76_13725 [Bacteroidota bacterium]